MKALLDTHAFLWWVTDDPRLTKRVHEIITDGDNQLLLSAASTWEIAVKVGLGRLQLGGDIERIIPEHLAANAIEALPVEHTHALRVARLPPHHKDPFDRMLISQAQVEGLAIISSDRVLTRYGVELIW